MKKRGVLSFFIYLLVFLQLLLAFIDEFIALKNPDDDLAGIAFYVIVFLLSIFCIPFIFKILHVLTGCKLFAICAIIVDAYIIYTFAPSTFKLFNTPLYSVEWIFVLIFCLFSLSFISNFLSLISGRD